MPRGKRPASYLSVAMQAQYSNWSPIDIVRRNSSYRWLVRLDCCRGRQ